MAKRNVTCGECVRVVSVAMIFRLCTQLLNVWSLECSLLIMGCVDQLTVQNVRNETTRHDGSNF